MSTTEEREAYQGDAQDFAHKQSLRTSEAPRCTCRDFPGADQFCMAHKVLQTFTDDLSTGLYVDGQGNTQVAVMGRTLKAPHIPAAFINCIADSGTKAEAVVYLQQTWNELQRALAALRDIRELHGAFRAERYTPPGGSIVVAICDNVLGKQHGKG